MWLVSLLVVAVVVRRTDAIALGLLLAVASLAVSVVVLACSAPAATVSEDA